MATWIAPIDSETDPDAPLTSSLAKRWDNNVIAMTEGASGAPRVQDGALGSTVTTAGQLWVTNRMPNHGVGGYVLDRVTPVGVSIATGASQGAGQPAQYLYYWSFTAMTGGSVRIQAEVSSSNGSTAALMGIIKNGVLQSEQSAAGTTLQTRTFDIAYNAGDQITVRAGSTSNATSTAYITNLRVLSDKSGVYRA